MTDRFLSQQLDKTKEFQNIIAKEVFAAVFSTRVPRQLVDAVVDQVLGTEIVRLNHRADYVIEELPAGAEEIGEGYVLLAVKTEYVISNVSNKSVKVPIRVGYPTPGPKAAKDYSRLRSISIGDRQLSDEEIAEGDTAAEDDVDKIRFVWWRDLDPGARLGVETVCELVKERSDNELWVSLFPSMGMELSLLVKVEGVQFGVRSCSRSELEQQMGSMKADEHNRFKLDGPVLPHQSIVIWWRPE